MGSPPASDLVLIPNTGLTADASGTIGKIATFLRVFGRFGPCDGIPPFARRAKRLHRGGTLQGRNMTEWGFWIAAAGITLAVFALLVQALRRSAPVQDTEVSLKVYRDQLTEVDLSLIHI